MSSLLQRSTQPPATWPCLFFSLGIAAPVCSTDSLTALLGRDSAPRTFPTSRASELLTLDCDASPDFDFRARVHLCVVCWVWSCPLVGGEGEWKSHHFQVPPKLGDWQQSSPIGSDQPHSFTHQVRASQHGSGHEGSKTRKPQFCGPGEIIGMG